MTTKTISLNTIVDVKEFVNTVARYDFEVDLVSGRYHIDGKSIKEAVSKAEAEEIKTKLEEAGAKVELK